MVSTQLPQSPEVLPPRLNQGLIAKNRYWYWRGWRIRYQVFPATAEAATGLPLLLLHGFGASLEQWRDNIAALSQQHTVYAVDLLGFGDSQKAVTVFNTDLWSAQVYDFWKAWIGQPTILMGHSLGALVALNNAVNYPEMAHRLIMLTLPAAREELLSGWVESSSRMAEQFFSTPLLIRPIFEIFRRPGIIRRVLTSIYQRKERVDDILIRQFVQPTEERGAARTLCYLVRSRTDLQFTPRTKQLIPQLTVPTLLLWGEADKVIPLSWGEQVAPLSPLVTFNIIPNVGHCLYDDEPELINQRILDWLEEQFSV
ncbi:alpha/beta fold hydrolase [Oscillatoria sp. CS-180]|uniref:alpha/beta fold hydrolase n=1 Tax=Oscillatoria sp. CS-180 TaxID=3021720 RepID=UPI00232D092A|nr:alpha/beta fold hydrolase [Oscillatoria sp. CS-180]MDB9525064.1 alpha/beta fold hydrolase [Oscillatoria sp. CS-180]